MNIAAHLKEVNLHLSQAEQALRQAEIVLGDRGLAPITLQGVVMLRTMLTQLTPNREVEKNAPYKTTMSVLETMSEIAEAVSGLLLAISDRDAKFAACSKDRSRICHAEIADVTDAEQELARALGRFVDERVRQVLDEREG